MSPRLDSLPLFRRSVGSRDRREETAKRRGEKKDEEDEYKYRWGARERGKGREGKSGAEAGNVGRKGSLSLIFSWAAIIPLARSTYRN